MGLGQYNSLGEYCVPHTASSVFLILTVACDILPFLEFNMGIHRRQGHATLPFLKIDRPHAPSPLPSRAPDRAPPVGAPLGGGGRRGLVYVCHVLIGALDGGSNLRNGQVNCHYFSNFQVDFKKV